MYQCLYKHTKELGLRYTHAGIILNKKIQYFSPLIKSMVSVRKLLIIVSTIQPMEVL